MDPGQCLQEDVNTVYIPLCGGVGGGADASPHMDEMLINRRCWFLESQVCHAA